MHVLYRFFDSSDTLLYVGRTINPGRRWSEHERDKEWWSDVATVRTEHYSSAEALASAELSAIRTENPVFNIAGRLVEYIEPVRFICFNRGNYCDAVSCGAYPVSFRGIVGTDYKVYLCEDHLELSLRSGQVGGSFLPKSFCRSINTFEVIPDVTQVMYIRQFPGKSRLGRVFTVPHPEHPAARVSCASCNVLFGTEALVRLISFGLETDNDTLAARHNVHCYAPKAVLTHANCVSSESDAEALFRSGYSDEDLYRWWEPFYQWRRS